MQPTATMAHSLGPAGWYTRWYMRKGYLRGHSGRETVRHRGQGSQLVQRGMPGGRARRCTARALGGGGAGPASAWRCTRVGSTGAGVLASAASVGGGVRSPDGQGEEGEGANEGAHVCGAGVGRAACQGQNAQPCRGGSRLPVTTMLGSAEAGPRSRQRPARLQRWQCWPAGRLGPLEAKLKASPPKKGMTMARMQMMPTYRERTTTRCRQGLMDGAKEDESDGGKRAGGEGGAVPARTPGRQRLGSPSRGAAGRCHRCWAHPRRWRPAASKTGGGGCRRAGNVWPGLGSLEPPPSWRRFPQQAQQAQPGAAGGPLHSPCPGGTWRWPRPCAQPCGLQGRAGEGKVRRGDHR